MKTNISYKIFLLHIVILITLNTFGETCLSPQSQIPTLHQHEINPKNFITNIRKHLKNPEKVTQLLKHTPFHWEIIQNRRKVYILLKKIEQILSMEGEKTNLIQNDSPILYELLKLLNFKQDPSGSFFIPNKDLDDSWRMLEIFYHLIENAYQHWHDRTLKNTHIPNGCLIVLGKTINSKAEPIFFFSVVTASEFVIDEEEGLVREAIVPRGKRGKGTKLGIALSQRIPTFLEYIVLYDVDFRISSVYETAFIPNKSGKWQYQTASHKAIPGSSAILEFKIADWLQPQINPKIAFQTAA